MVDVENVYTSYTLLLSQYQGRDYIFWLYNRVDISVTYCVNHYILN